MNKTVEEHANRFEAVSSKEIQLNVLRRELNLHECMAKADAVNRCGIAQSITRMRAREIRSALRHPAGYLVACTRR